MKKALFLAAALLATSAFAEKIAVLDSKQIFTNSPAYVAITKLADTKYKKQKQALETQREQFTQEMTQLTRDKLTQKQGSFKTREAELITKRAKLTEEQNKFTQTVMEDQNTQMKKLFTKFQSIVDTYAKQNKIDIVLNKFVVITTNNAKLDITKEIAKRFAKVTT